MDACTHDCNEQPENIIPSEVYQRRRRKKKTKRDSQETRFCLLKNFSTDNNLLRVSESLGLSKPDYFNYLSLSGAYKVDGTDDNKEFQDTMVRFCSLRTMIFLLFRSVRIRPTLGLY